MLIDETFERAVRVALHDLSADVEPDMRIFDTVVERHARGRRRARAAQGAGVLAALTAAAALVIAPSVAGTAAARGPQLALASFKLRLPARSHVLAPGSHVCLPAIVMYPGTKVPGGGPANPSEPNVVSAATGDGGCVSILLTAPFLPGSADAPTPMNDTATHPVQIAGYRGTIGTVTWTGGNMTYDGITIPNGTTQSELTLEVPAAHGQIEDLLFAAEGLTREQLMSIVSAGLSAPPVAR